MTYQSKLCNVQTIEYLDFLNSWQKNVGLYRFRPDHVFKYKENDIFKKEVSGLLCKFSAITIASVAGYTPSEENALASVARAVDDSARATLDESTGIHFVDTIVILPTSRLTVIYYFAHDFFNISRVLKTTATIPSSVAAALSAAFALCGLFAIFSFWKFHPTSSNKMKGYISDLQSGDVVPFLHSLCIGTRIQSLQAVMLVQRHQTRWETIL